MEGPGIAVPSRVASATTARMINLTLALSMALSAVMLVRLGAGDQVFSAAGSLRRDVLPLLYLLTGLIVVRRGATSRHLLATPLWLWAPALAALLSFVVNLDDFLGDAQVSDAVQGILLFVGFTVVGLAGVAAGRWTDVDRRALLLLLAVGSVAGVLMPYPGLVLTPYTTLAVPMVFCGLLLAVKGDRHRLRWLSLSVFLVAVALARGSLHPAPGLPVSLALIATIGVGAALVVAVLLPREVRAIGLVVSAIAAVGLLSSPPVVSYLTGHYTGTDVTLAQRAYEASQVEHTAISTPLGLVVGRGPAATVDLSSSPDRVTLLATGRNLSAVDDVHLLPAYVLLKLGLMGLLCMVWILVVVLRMIWAELCVRDVDLWRVCLLIFAVGGIANSFPAGTEFFSNPVVPLFLGILWAHQRRPDTISIPTARADHRRPRAGLAAGSRGQRSTSPPAVVRAD